MRTAQLAGATTSIWVAGKDDWWFGGTAGDRMDVLPEKTEYEAGEIARFQVRMPFRTATRARHRRARRRHAAASSRR